MAAIGIQRLRRLLLCSLQHTRSFKDFICSRRASSPSDQPRSNSRLYPCPGSFSDSTSYSSPSRTVFSEGRQNREAGQGDARSVAPHPRSSILQTAQYYASSSRRPAASAAGTAKARPADSCTNTHAYSTARADTVGSAHPGFTTDVIPATSLGCHQSFNSSACSCSCSASAYTASAAAGPADTSAADTSAADGSAADDPTAGSSATKTSGYSMVT